EEQEYVDAIIDAVHWLGFDWHAPEPALGEAKASHLYFASDYFDFMYRAAEALVVAGHAYVDEQSAEEMRASRGDFATPGRASPHRSRTPDENLARLRQMKNGELADGAAVLRAKIDMASPNINLRDPALYRIKRATHHNTGDTSLELALRDDLGPKAARAMAVLDPVRLTLTNWVETFGDAAHREPCQAPVHPQHPALGTRDLRLGPELWIERDDFAEVPAK